jgi:hypothetical protein
MWVRCLVAGVVAAALADEAAAELWHIRTKGTLLQSSVSLFSFFTVEWVERIDISVISTCISLSQFHHCRVGGLARSH